MARHLKTLAIAAAFLSLSGCASLPNPESHASKTEWMKAVLEYRKQYSEHPADYEIKMRLQQAELNAAEAYYEDGVALENQGLLDDAIYQFREGLSAMPNNEKVANALKSTLQEKEATTFYQQAVDLDKAGKEDDAKSLLKQALEADPDHTGAKALLDKITAEGEEKEGGLTLTSKEPISLHFNKTGLKAAFNFIAKAFGVNIIFDEAIKDQDVTLAAENVTFEQALDLILNTTQTFYKKIGPNTLLVADDTRAKRDQYDDLIIKTIQLNSIKAADMAAILKSTIDLKHVNVNEKLNTLIIRDTADVLKLADEIIAANDRPPAEVLLDVEILEVNRNKEEKLGFSYGSQLAYAWSQSPMPLATLGNTDFANLVGQGTVVLPAVTFNYFKNDVDAKTLAHPQIRALDNQEAKIHIGDRVPITSAVIQQTTGQVQTTFNYTDIGVLLNVTPIINLDRTVQVKLNLEVSSLGPNLGTADNPAYQIGTRDASTQMLLHDGESAILGGLIQDSERNTYVKVPLLGDIPVIGRLFGTSSDESGQRTDILLTITPRIVRDWNFPRKDLREVYSGTAEKVSSEPLFGAFEVKAKGTKGPKIDVGSAEPAQAAPGAAPTAVAPQTQAPSNLPAVSGGIVFSFEKPELGAALGSPVTVKLYGENLGQLKQLPLAVAYNGAFLKFVSASAGSAQVTDVKADTDEEHGLARFNLALNPGAQPQEKVELVDMVLSGNAPGISYLVFLNPAFKDENGKDIHAQARASRIVVK